MHKKFEEWCHDSPGMTDCNMAQSLLEGHIEYTGKKEHNINKVFHVRERERERVFWQADHGNYNPFD